MDDFQNFVLMSKEGAVHADEGQEVKRKAKETVERLHHEDIRKKRLSKGDMRARNMW